MSGSAYSALPKHHVVVVQPVSGVINLSVPALYINVGGKPKLVDSLIKYFIAYSQRSMSWKRQVSRALGLFYDYSVAFASHKNFQLTHIEFLRYFVLAIHNGTRDRKTLLDPLGLYWPSSKVSQAKAVVSCLFDFIEWCHIEGIIEKDITSASDFPTNEVSCLRYLHEAAKQKSRMFLSHIVSTKKLAENIANRKQREFVELKGSIPYKSAEDKIFPGEIIEPLLKHGFVLNEECDNPYHREDITAKYITLMLLFGGLRVSEPFHMWFNDIIPSFDGGPKAFIRHPSESKTYLVGEEELSRREYLARSGLAPRNDPSDTSSYHAGWKSLAVDTNQSAPIFFLHRPASILIASIHIGYLRYRQALMKIREKRGEPNHPFLYVSKHAGYEGNPYSIKSYNKALERAYERLNKFCGLNIKLRKQYGTTPHGMRHYYGQALIDCGMPTKVIQKAMHHRSPLSQGIYTEPKFKKIQSMLNDARNKIESGESETATLNHIHTVEDMIRGY